MLAVVYWYHRYEDKNIGFQVWSSGALQCRSSKSRMRWWTTSNKPIVSTRSCILSPLRLFIAGTWQVLGHYSWIQRQLSLQIVVGDNYHLMFQLYIHMTQFTKTQSLNIIMQQIPPRCSKLIPTSVILSTLVSTIEHQVS